MDSTLQTRLHLWRQKNFPDADADQQLLGIVEEVGELAHAVLKHKQGIRRNEHLEAKMVDAVGDIQVFLAGYCSYMGFNMQAIFERVAAQVMERDWITYPDTGFPPNPPTDDMYDLDLPGA